MSYDNLKHLGQLRPLSHSMFQLPSQDDMHGKSSLSYFEHMEPENFEIATTVHPHNKITVGICAMDKKTRSKPMKEILSRLPPEEFEIVIFGDDTILNKPVEQWPPCDALISFFSAGFPLDKAEKYAALNHPFIMNDLKEQWTVRSRKQVYEKLQANGIAVARHAIADRSDPNLVFEETENYVVINGRKIQKPFVEKPFDAEDHNVYIYYPTSAGGGSKRLFRKVGDRSSQFYPEVSTVRREGSYIYEEFLNTQGTDVKVYTVGKDYAHAEARKSPVLDGKVVRDSGGKEVRYPVILTAEEKEIARKIVVAFKQTVCGFDLLRVRGKSYVCDVNGWSFVKNSRKYYDDCSTTIREVLLKALAPQRLLYSRLFHMRQMEESMGKAPLSPTSLKSAEAEDEFGVGLVEEELRCVIAVVRHGDRTPKQKLKMKVYHRKLIDFFHRHSSDESEVKMKSVAQLQELLELTYSLLKEYGGLENEKEAEVDRWEKEGGHKFEKLRQMYSVLSRWKFQGINRKVQLKPRKWKTVTRKDDEGNDVEAQEAMELLLILKWGGDLTQAGKAQAEDLGHQFRKNLYPGEEEGLRRLHSTFRHDLKIYTSDEGRVQLTAAGFAKGFLELEGELTPILVSLVTTLGKGANKMLDHSGQTEAIAELEQAKKNLHRILGMDEEVTDEFLAEHLADAPESVCSAFKKLGNPKRALMTLYNLVGDMKDHIESSWMKSFQSGERKVYYGQELPGLMFARWKKLHTDLYDPEHNVFDMSKIPDVYDCIKYDLLHNPDLGFEGMKDLFKLAQTLADSLVPQEYGLTKNEKQVVGYTVCQSLLAKINADIEKVCESSETNDEEVTVVQPPPKEDRAGAESEEEHVDDDEEHRGYQLDPTHARELLINTPDRQVRSRLYFTSESHMHTLINSLRLPPPDLQVPTEPLVDDISQRLIEETPELCYLTHIVIRVFENRNLPLEDPMRFRVQLLFSPGAEFDVNTTYQEHVVPVTSMVPIGVCSAHDFLRHITACTDWVDRQRNSAQA